ncbi:hypothetical protein Taro_049983 [Colocasia esculenta]|uniref:Uncharacterized protein n=1 Tax=Colocasia esculenta TaxID=4460 RepID=A0A843XC97_COLES|nr:hypothetical protein [Colocasia esculenta]
MAHAYGGIRLYRSLSLPHLIRSLPLPHLRCSLPLPPLRSFLSLPRPSTPSTPSWGRGIGRREPTRGVTERRLSDGQQWNVSLHFNGTSLDDVIASVLAGVGSSDWQPMCEIWTNGDELVIFKIVII